MMEGGRLRMDGRGLFQNAIFQLLSSNFALGPGLFFDMRAESAARIEDCGNQGW